MDTSKHNDVFNPSKFRGAIAVVGVGSLGSAVALQLAKLGLSDRMTLYDADLVEPHNLPNQILYGPGDVGEYKVIAATEAIHKLTGSSGGWASEHVTTMRQLDYMSHVFVCVDSMSTRMAIFNNCILYNPVITYYAEGRIGARTVMTNGFNPQDMKKAREYRERLYPDEDVADDVGGCGMTLSIGATAMMAACRMVWQFFNHFNPKPNGQLPAYEEIAFRADTLEVQSRGWL